MEVFATRQAIFNEKKEVYGYELLFRAGFESYYDTLDGDKAAVDMMAFVNFSELTDGKRGFATFPRNLLLKDFPAMLPCDMVTIGIDADIDLDEELLATFRTLKEAGCRLAIENFTLDQIASPLVELADVVKVDFSTTTVIDRLAITEQLAKSDVKLLARKVSTAEEFDQAVEWGYSYFHGSFVNKPVIRPDKEISTNKLVHLQVLNEVNRPELPYEKLEDLIKKDVSLTYKLLRFMNSVWFGLRYEVKSIKHALVLLGPKEVKKWASLVVVGGTADDKPRELLRCSLARAKVAEQIAPLIGKKAVASDLFLMGMFSVIDALMDVPMANVLSQLPLSENIMTALIEGKGPFRPVLDLVVAYEQAEWEAFSSQAALLELDEAVVPELFRDALKWANNALEVI